MKLFILRSLLFVVCSITVLLAMWIPYVISADKCMKINNNQHILFLGNSHIECSIDDRIVNDSFNFARGGERLECAYNKLKLLTEKNIGIIDTVYMSYDYMFLTTSTDSVPPPSYYYSPWLMSQNTLTDWLKIFTLSSVDYSFGHFSHLYVYWKYMDMLSFLRTEDSIVKNKYLGGYLYLKRDKLDEAIRRRKSNPTISIDKIDRLNLYFLDRIVDYCKKNGIVLCFITPPQHKLAPENMVLCHQLHSERYGDIPLLDFRYMELPDSCFGDLDHLNYRGAKFFSEYLEKKVIHKNNYPSNKENEGIKE